MSDTVVNVVTETVREVVVTDNGPEQVAIAEERVVETAVEVTAGPQGIQGIQGPPGEDAEPFRYHHAQGVPSATWTVVHNLNGFPSVTVVTSAGDVVEGDIDYPDANTVVLSFAGAFAGDAYLS